MQAPRPTEISIEVAVGRVIRKLRKERKLKQVEVSAATGYSLKAIGIIERGEKSASLGTLYDLATFYSVGLDAIITQALRTKGTQL